MSDNCMNENRIIRLEERLDENMMRLSLLKRIDSRS